MEWKIVESLQGYEIARLGTSKILLNFLLTEQLFPVGRLKTEPLFLLLDEIQLSRSRDSLISFNEIVFAFPARISSNLCSAR